VLGVGLFSKFIYTHAVSAPLIALALGAVLSPLASLSLSTWGNPFTILEDASRLTLAIGLMGSALNLPRLDVRKRWRALAVLLGLVMVLMWAASTFLVILILRLPILVAALIGAAITSTDPILARAVVEGELAVENIPHRIRYTLIEESGLNDGLGLPFVQLPALLLALPPAAALREWTLQVALLAVVGGTALGIAIGWGAGAALNWSDDHDLIERSFFFAYPVALALFTVAVVRLRGADDVLGVFVAGLTFVAVIRRRLRVKGRERAEIQETIDHFFTLPVFLFLGLALPWRDWLALGWRAPAIVAAVLLLRRIPAVLVVFPLLKTQIYDVHEALFYGWFGPIGVSAIFYAALAVRETGLQEVWTVVSLIVASSVVAHGISGSPFSLRLGEHEERTTGRQ